MLLSETRTQRGVAVKPQVYVETYGCQMNVSDTELILGILGKAGYASCETPEAADVILLNTCAIRDRAEQRIWGRLGQLEPLRRLRPDLVVGVTGCMAKHVGEELHKGAAAVEVLASPDAYRNLPDLIAAARDTAQVDLRMDRDEHYRGIDPVRRPGVGGWVTIMRGCDRFCTFCIVPYVRGRERSVPPDEVVRQVESLARDGYREVTLLGQTVNAYRFDQVTFADLLERVAAVGGIHRVRFTSPHPGDFDQRTLEVMADHPAIMKHVHLPVQSGSDRILAAMRRGYTRQQYVELVERMRSAMPGITLTTDLIVGFSGETDADFEATLDLVRTMQYESAFMFKYSERDGTTAAREQPDTVGEKVKAARLASLIDLQEAISARRNRAWVGRRVEVLVEGRSRRDAGRFHGKSEHGKTVVFPERPGGSPEPGALVPVLIESSTSHTLCGVLATT